MEKQASSDMLMGMQTDKTLQEGNLAIRIELHIYLTFEPVILLLEIYPEVHLQLYIYIIWLFVASLFANEKY